MADFEFTAPQSIEGVLQALAHGGDNALVLAGGTNLLVDIRAGATHPTLVVDLRYLDSLRQIHYDGREIRVGALTTLSALEHSSIIQQHVPILSEMAKWFANPLIRNAATLGGNLTNASPWADAVIPLLALDATLWLRSTENNQRNIKLSDFISGKLKTRTATRELITHLSFPTYSHNTRWYYYKLGRRKAGTSSIVSISLLVELKDERVEKAGIALGVAAPIPLRAHLSEAAITGETLSENTIAKCLQVLESEIAPSDDIFASAAYRRSMAKALVARALKQFSVL